VGGQIFIVSQWNTLKKKRKETASRTSGPPKGVAEGTGAFDSRRKQRESTLFHSEEKVDGGREKERCAFI